MVEVEGLLERLRASSGGGGSGRHLSLHKLRARWDDPGSYGRQSVGERFAFEERNALYEDAARAAGFATEQISRFGRFDPARAADAAWAASDILHTAAKALGNLHLRKAADADDRAARQPYAKIPPPTPAGNALRTIARVFAVRAVEEPVPECVGAHLRGAEDSALDEVVGQGESGHRRSGQGAGLCGAGRLGS